MPRRCEGSTGKRRSVTAHPHTATDRCPTRPAQPSPCDARAGARGRTTSRLAGLTASGEVQCGRIGYLWRERAARMRGMKTILAKLPFLTVAALLMVAALSVPAFAADDGGTYMHMR